MQFNTDLLDNFTVFSSRLAMRQPVKREAEEDWGR